MKGKMDLDSKLYMWKIIQWVLPAIFLLIGTGITIFSNFKIHHIEKQIKTENAIKVEAQRTQDKEEIISEVDRTSTDNRQLIELLKNVSDKEQKDRNKIIGELYWYGLSEFLAKFKFVLHCLDITEPFSKNIIETFRPRDISMAPNLNKLEKNMIYDIVMQYDFTKKSMNCDFTSSTFLQSLTVDLNKKTKDILSKYAATGSPELIKEIELMASYTDNLLGAFGPWGQVGAWNPNRMEQQKSRENTARDLNDFIWKLKNDLEISGIFRT